MVSFHSDMLAHESNLPKKIQKDSTSLLPSNRFIATNSLDCWIPLKFLRHTISLSY